MGGQSSTGAKETSSTMRFFTKFFFFVLIGLSLTEKEKLPQISVTQVRSSSDIPSIHITFPNGEEDNMILERRYPNQQTRMMGEKHCNYIGHLEKDSESCVAVTGCYGQENLDFSINSNHYGHTLTYRLNTNGDVELIRIDDELVNKIEAVNQIPSDMLQNDAIEQIPDDINRAEYKAISVSGGNLLETLTKWGSIFTVEADITVTKIVEESVVKNDPKANWMEVFSFTAGTNPWLGKTKHLLPIPTVGICSGYNGKSGQSFSRYIFINVPLNGKKLIEKFKFDLGKKYHIKIQQFKDNQDEDTILKIEVNDKIIFLGKNTAPSEFNNVKVYVSDPWLYPFKSEYGKLENLKYTTDPSSSLYKCNASLAYDDCCRKDYPCGENEGHCEDDSDCKNGLRCGESNCGKDWPDSSWNCCTSAPRICNAKTANGHCCSEQFPCDDNEGDCDNDKDCKDGLRCGYNNCGNEWPDSSWDCCTSKPLPQVPPSTFKLMLAYDDKFTDQPFTNTLEKRNNYLNALIAHLQARFCRPSEFGAKIQIEADTKHMVGEKWLVYRRFLCQACKKKDQYPGYDQYHSWAFITRDNTPAVYGFGSVGTVCNPGCLIVCTHENLQRMGATLSHEIGHNFGWSKEHIHEDKPIQFRETYERKVTDGEWCMEANPNACKDYSCGCNQYGSLNEGKCSSGTCVCKENVVGEKCDKCKPGFVAGPNGTLDKDNQICLKAELVNCKIGDGVGDSEVKLKRKFTKENCILAVKKDYPTANGATMDVVCPSECNCYAEFGMKSWSGSRYTSCMFIQGASK